MVSIPCPLGTWRMMSQSNEVNNPNWNLKDILLTQNKLTVQIKTYCNYFYQIEFRKVCAEHLFKIWFIWIQLLYNNLFFKLRKVLLAGCAHKCVNLRTLEVSSWGQFSTWSIYSAADLDNCVNGLFYWPSNVFVCTCAFGTLQNEKLEKNTQNVIRRNSCEKVFIVNK